MDITLIDLAVILVAARLCAAGLERLRQPAVIGELVAGVIMGPTVLGLLPNVERAIFPLRARPALAGIAEVGLVIYVFNVGIDLDLRTALRRRGAVLSISAASLGVPLALGIVVALPLDSVYGSPHIGLGAFALFIGVAMSVTALPVLARLIDETGLQGTELGTLALACAGIEDAVAWLLLAVALALADGSGAGHSVVLVGETILFLGGIFLIAPGIWRRLRRRLGRRGSPETLTALAVAGAVAAAAASSAIGIQPVFGAVSFGAAIRRSFDAHGWLTPRLTPMARGVLLPVYFFLAGLSMNLRSLDARDVVWVAVLVVVACIGKIVGTGTAGRWAGLHWRQAGMLGLLMNTRGLVELVILNAGLQAGILDHRLYVVLVIMAVVTTLMTTPLIRTLLSGPRLRPTPESNRLEPAVAAFPRARAVDLNDL